MEARRGGGRVPRWRDPPGGAGRDRQGQPKEWEGGGARKEAEQKEGGRRAAAREKRDPPVVADGKRVSRGERAQQACPLARPGPQWPLRALSPPACRRSLAVLWAAQLAERETPRLLQDGSGVGVGVSWGGAKRALPCRPCAASPGLSPPRWGGGGGRLTYLVGGSLACCGCCYSLRVWSPRVQRSPAQLLDSQISRAS